MTRIRLLMALFAVLLLAASCQKQVADSDAIRAGILQHLNGVGTLNLSAMAMDIQSVSVSGNQAHADVEFRPRTGAPAGACMHVSYNLEKRDGAWVVQKTQPAGGIIRHPDPNQNPHQSQDLHSGSLPNFSDIMNPAGTPAQGALPPGHPPVKAQQPAAQPSGLDQTPVKKPR